jgi:hypothetical protein
MRNSNVGVAPGPVCINEPVDPGLASVDDLAAPTPQSSHKRNERGMSTLRTLGAFAGVAIAVSAIIGAVKANGHDQQFNEGKKRAAVGTGELVGGGSQSGDALVQTGVDEWNEWVGTWDTGDGSGGSQENSGATCDTPFAGMGDCAEEPATPQNNGNTAPAEQPQATGGEVFRYPLKDGTVVYCGPALPGPYNWGDAKKRQPQMQGTNNAWAGNLDAATIATGTHPGDGACVKP